MKTLIEYCISDGDWISYKSKLCGAANSIDYLFNTPITLYINELSFSYFNQWQFVIDAYQELGSLIQHLNTFSTESAIVNSFSPYNLQSIAIEAKCRDYVYLMIISIKTLLDLFACLVDVTVNQELREEHQMTDLKNVKKKLTNIAYKPVLATINLFLDKQLYQWIDMISTYRNRLIHRGYTIRPSFGFQKSDELIVNLYKGNFAQEEQFEVGRLFEQFITNLPKMEELTVNAFSQCIAALSDGPSVELHYRSSRGAREYLNRGIKEI